MRENHLADRPILSVIVPTHNRSQYALSCIAAVLAIEDEGIQLVVSDTSNDGKLRHALGDGSVSFLTDSRLKYVKIDEPSSLTKNHNAALAFADGEYVTVIGDDDGITRAALEAARWAADRAVPIVSQKVSANYAWPDFRSRTVGSGHAARLYVPRGAGGARWRVAKDDLQAALKGAFQATDWMPRCYQGVVRRDLLETIYAKTGAYFHGSSPDMSGAVSLACLVDRYLEVDIPLTIPGASSGSNSGRSAMNTHKGALISESQTNDFSEKGWIAGIPKFFSVETVWAHAGLASLANFKPELLPTFDYARLIALCSVRHPEFRAAIDEAVLELVGVREENRLAIEREIRRERLRRARYLLKRAMLPTAANGRKYFGGIVDIMAACQKYEKYSLENGLSFSSIENNIPALY